MILSVTDTTGRKIHFTYRKVELKDNDGNIVREDNFLDSIFYHVEVPDIYEESGSNEQWFETRYLLKFDIDLEPASPGYGELRQVIDANGNGERYGYLNGFFAPQKDVVNYWNFVADTLPTTIANRKCKRECSPRDPMNTCTNIDICVPHYCTDWYNRTVESCRRGCANVCYNGGELHCYEDCLFDCSNNWLYRQILDNCKENYVKYLRPYCQNYSVDSCYSRCLDEHLVKDGNGDWRYWYGDWTYLNHNLTTIHDAEGRLVIKNKFGMDPTIISFDRVIDQQLGELDLPEKHIRLEYHDLPLEQEWANHQGYKIFDHIIPWPASHANSQFVQDFDHFDSVNICPDDGADGVGALQINKGAAAAPQLPVLATVVYDLYDSVRTLYLDKNQPVLREVLFTPDQQNPQQYVAYESTDYNFNPHNGSLNRGIAYPVPDQAQPLARKRVCTITSNSILEVNNPFDLPERIWVFPAPGFEGEQNPKLVKLQHNSEGQIQDLYSGGLSSESTHLNFLRETEDPLSRIAQIKADVGNGKDPVVTQFYYDNPADIYPKDVVSTDGSWAHIWDIDAKGAAPTLAGVLGNVDQTLKRSFEYDSSTGFLRKRQQTYGNTPGKVETFFYDPAGRLDKITQAKDPNAVP
ncbi:hypothetical protein L0222_12695 [bacterium]|nr:hypothetical protein [bacterium]